MSLILPFETREVRALKYVHFKIQKKTHNIQFKTISEPHKKDHQSEV